MSFCLKRFCLKKIIMWRNSLWSIVCLLILCGCEKVDLSEYLQNKEDGCRVSFVFGVISQSDFEPVSTRGQNGMAEIAKVMNFAVFKDGEKVKSINMKNDDEGFGTVSLTLAEGHYQIVALAHSCAGNATISSPDKITFPNNKVTDTFCYYKEIDVEGSKSYDANMTRVVSMFRLSLTQEIPTDVTQMKFYYTGGSSTLDATTGLGCVNSRQTELRDVSNRAAGQVFETYTFPHEDYGEINMTITALTASGDAYKELSLSAVPITIRKITTYEGTMFDAAGQSSGAMTLQFTAGSDWEGEEKYKL